MKNSGKTYAMIGVVFATLLIAGIATYQSYVPAPNQHQAAPDPSDSSVLASNFRILSEAHTDVCAYIGDQKANTKYINSLADDYYLQGSCCTPMVYSHYLSQIEGLKNYSNISIIPRD
ncbi:MAG: hypothetical protein LYZ70_02495, partial [Nitrososphaerales archaeon]|nr:hypothetical protein [Nitrososphaerales archaeon]